MGTLIQHLPIPTENRRSGPQPSAGTSTAFEAVRSEVLRNAAIRVLERVTGTPQDGVPWEDVRRRLVVLGQALSDFLDGTPHEGDPAPNDTLSRRLLEQLRVEVLTGWLTRRADPPPSRSAIEAMCRAFEHCEQWMAVDADDALRRELAGPGGLELTVEVAHDLRSPLTSVLFLAETLQREGSGPVTELQHRQLGLIYSAALGLSTLVSNVIELARGGNSLSDDDPSPFSVVDVFDSVRDIVHPMAEEKGLALRMLPPATDHRIGPAQALGRVLLNLTTNAIKFTEEGFVEIVGKSVSLTRIEFSVRDSGHGINPDAVDTLYLPFRPGTGGKRRAFSGTGVGLALCRRLVRAMGSELHFETTEGWGTRFYFELDLPPAGHL